MALRSWDPSKAGLLAMYDPRQKRKLYSDDDRSELRLLDLQQLLHGTGVLSSVHLPGTQVYILARSVTCLRFRSTSSSRTS